MSYDVYLHDDNGAPCKVRPFLGGGTIEVNPDTMEEVPQVEARLNVTYNYSRVYGLAIKAALWDLHQSNLGLPSLRNTLRSMGEDGLRHLDGRTALIVRDALEAVLAQLTNNRPYENDYWAPTLGNAAVPLRVLASWCHEHPSGTFRVH